MLVPDVLQTINTVSGPGTDVMILALSLATTPPVLTSQTKSSPSTPPAVSTTVCSYKLTKLSGAQVTMIENKVSVMHIGMDLTMWMIGLPVNKIMRRFVILMVVKEAVPLQDQTVLPVTMKTSSTATPLDSVSTRTWYAMATHIQVVVGMMRVLITAMTYTTRRGLSRDTQP